jgi:rare lipoprotein A
MSHLNLGAAILLACVAGAGAAGFAPHAGAAESTAPQDATLSPQATRMTTAPPDLSGRKRVGKASFYARKFAGKQMSDGTKMDPHGDNAASRTLPLGTTAKVTNIVTGQSAIVTIKDRGPYAKGRILDLSPSTAQRIGITRDNGVAQVQVDPIAVPLPDGSVKPGVAARGVKRDKQAAGDLGK